MIQNPFAVATARLGLTVVLPVASGMGLSQPVQLPLQPVPLFECDIHTHIMDVANYQIARMLGKTVGTEPSSYSIKYNMQSPQLAGMGPLSPPPVTTNPIQIPTSTHVSPPMKTLTPTIPYGQTTTMTMTTTTQTSLPMPFPSLK